MWPVVIRELRVGARDRWNNWYRVLAAAAVLLIGWFTRLFDPNSDGRSLFTTVHQILLCVIWVFVPLATADCISKERREGTLGLLFLTPLKAWHVVIAKSLVHANRAFFIWLAAVPVLTLSFLMGGVTKWEVLLSVLIHASSLCCALSAGILVSASFTEWSRVMVAALFAATVVFLGYLTVQFGIAVQLGGFPTTPWGWPLEQLWSVGLPLITNRDGQTWYILTAGQPTLYRSSVKWMLTGSIASVLLLITVVTFSARIVRRTVAARRSGIILGDSCRREDDLPSAAPKMVARRIGAKSRGLA